jgi:proline iminopeptidase
MNTSGSPREMIQEIENVTLQSGNASLTVRFYPNPGADTVILLHGGPGVPDEMTEVRETLSPSLQVITFDQRGTGIKPCRRCTYTIPEYLQDINTLASHFNLDRFHLFGHSWGGLYAQLYAQSFPHRIESLFLCSPASGCGRKIWKLTEKEVFRYNRSRSTSVQWIGMGLNSLLGRLGSNSACRRLFRQVIVNYHKGFGVAGPEEEKLAKINAGPVNRTRHSIMNHAPLEFFGSTPYPVIITYGDQDAYGKSKEYTFSRFPEARYEIIPQCGHTPWKHNLPEFAKILNSFYQNGFTKVY